jgi:hypothetical protein
MMKKVILLLFFSMIAVAGNAQLDRYKYVVVPTQFDGFKNVNQFRTSTLIKHLFTQNGFTAVYDDKITPELASKPCQGLRADMVDTSSLLSTKVKLVLKDCYGQVVFETIEGKSKQKDFELAYREAITEAFVVIQALGYSYTPGDSVATSKEVASDEKSPIGEESTALTETAEIAPAVAATAGVTPEVITETQAAERWYAQPTDNGYQLVDSEPRVRMNLLETSQKDTFIAMVEGAPMGMVYKKDGDWWHEFYEDGKAILRKLDLTF